ncbi:MAG: aspartate aminotransferase family protein [Alphaproteobacteria bacterium]|nr:MAG: aspartate aminotransferase family protein [Alphaproteobacteria bacterium]
MTVQPTRNSTARWRRSDLAHHLHPFTDTRALAEAGGSRIITGAEGARLIDSEGQRLLDGMAGLWCVNVGYGRKELAQAAYDQMLELPYYNTFFKTATPPSVELAERLSTLTPAGLAHAFFGSSGSEANDTMVRMVRHFWNLEGRPTKKTFISREYAYHGSTMAAASLGGMSAMHAQADLPLPGFVHVMPPYWYDYGGDLSPEAFAKKAAQAVEDKILELGSDNVAAFIGEPIQGAGGVIIPPEGYWPEVQRICRKYDVLLVIDEVICGFGRTGYWFASEYFGLEPDLMTLAKGITSGYQPLSALMVGDRVATTLIDKGGEFFHGFTYSGHPVCCAVALANIDILEREHLIERTREETGPHLKQCLATLADHPLVGEVRSLGLLAGIELVKDKATRARFDDVGKVGLICRDHCFENGAVLRAVRDTMVMSPPLTVTRADIEEMVDVLRRALDLTARDVGMS